MSTSTLLSTNLVMQLGSTMNITDQIEMIMLISTMTASLMVTRDNSIRNKKMNRTLLALVTIMLASCIIVEICSLVMDLTLSKLRIRPSLQLSVMHGSLVLWTSLKLMYSTTVVNYATILYACDRVQ